MKYVSSLGQNVTCVNLQGSGFGFLAVFFIFLLTSCSSERSPNDIEAVSIVQKSYIDRNRAITVKDVMERRPGCSSNTWKAARTGAGDWLVTLTCEILISDEYLERARQYLVEQQTSAIRSQVSDLQSVVSTAENNVNRLTSPIASVTSSSSPSVYKPPPSETEEHHFMTFFLDQTSGNVQLTDDQLIKAVKPAEGAPDIMQRLWAAGWNPRGLFAQMRYMNELEGKPRAEYKTRNVKPHLTRLRSKLYEVRNDFKNEIEANERSAQRRADGAARQLAEKERRAAVAAQDRALRIKKAEEELAEHRHQLEAAIKSLDVTEADAISKARQAVPHEQIVERWEWFLSPDKTAIPLRHYLAVIEDGSPERIISEIREMAPKDAAGGEIFRHYSKANFRARAGDTGRSVLLNYPSFRFLISVR